VVCTAMKYANYSVVICIILLFFSCQDGTRNQPELTQSQPMKDLNEKIEIKQIYNSELSISTISISNFSDKILNIDLITIRIFPYDGPDMDPKVGARSLMIPSYLITDKEKDYVTLQLKNRNDAIDLENPPLNAGFWLLPGVTARFFRKIIKAPVFIDANRIYGEVGLSGSLVGIDGKACRVISKEGNIVPLWNNRY
jgi:hypothetical protein